LISIDALGIHLGPLYIRFYALCLIGGMLAGVWLISKRAPRQNLNPQHVWDGFFWALVPGIIGARLYHVFTPSPASGLTTQYYLENPAQIFAIWNGGLGIYGAIVGGFIGVLAYSLRHKQPLFRWLDLVVPGLALGQAIGRWGNFINQELYGAPANLPWAVFIRPENRLRGYEVYETFHPLFLYESLWNLATCFLLIYLDRRLKNRRRAGDLFLLYLISYGLIRFLLDFLRLDSHSAGGSFTTAQGLSLAIIGVSALVLLARQALTRPAIETESAIEADQTSPATPAN
jgi:phosphatidylglycerol---prolipoprotein diacylglyceryl transferase